MIPKATCYRKPVASSVTRFRLVVSLDLHGILTDRMLEHCDAVVTYHTYPHIDFVETGKRAAFLLTRMLDGNIRPVTARVKIPALVRGDEMITETGAIRECIQLAKQIEASETGLSAGVMWGNPFTDVPERRARICKAWDIRSALDRFFRWMMLWHFIRQRMYFVEVK